MKHAFLIIAHKNWNQLILLLRQIDALNHDIFIHVDKKAKGVPVKRIKEAVRYSKICIYSEYSVFWGGYELVQTELFLYGKAHAIGYDYYHLLSGQDLLLVSPDKFDTFFEDNNGFEFIEFKEDQLNNDPEI